MPDSTPCPPWCDRKHLDDPTEPDPVHERGGDVVPGVVRVVSGTPGVSLCALAVGCEVRPVLFTSAVNTDEIWLAIELGEQGPGITLNVETWRRVLPALSALAALP